MAVTRVIELFDCKGIDYRYSVKTSDNQPELEKKNSEKDFWNIDVENRVESFIERQVDD